MITMLLNASLNNILDKLDYTRVIRQDKIIPNKWPPVMNSPYRPGYEWLFGYERKLAKFLEPWLKKFRYELIGENGVLSEALSNAYCHGNRKNSKLDIRVVVYLADQGLMIRIRDCGDGFDVQKTFRNLSRGKHYYHLAGNGLRLMMESEKFGIFFDEGGAAFYFLYLFSEDFSSFKCILGCDGERGKTRYSTSTRPSENDELNLRMFTAFLPDTIDWVESCMLVDERGSYVAACNIEEGRMLELFSICKDLCSRVDQFDSSLAIGDAEHLTVFSEDEAIFLKYYHESERLLVVILPQDANPVLTRMHYPRLVSHLSSFLPA